MSEADPNHEPEETGHVPGGPGLPRAALLTAGRAWAGRVLGRVAVFLRGNMRLRSDEVGFGRGRHRPGPPPFTRLAVTQMISLGADALVTVALAGSLFFNISVTAARGRVALSLLLTIAPFGVVAPLLGPVIDRARGGRRAMIVASAIGRAVACLFMARYIHSLLLFPAAFLTLVSSKAYTVAKAALVPTVVERNEDLVEANSKLAIGGAIAGFAASIPGVPILKLFGAATLLRVDIVLFILCALSALRLAPARPERIPAIEPPAGTPAPGAAFAPTPGAVELAPGALTAATVAIAALRFLVGFMVFLVAFAFRRTHAPAWWYGFILAASVGGNLVGAAIAPRLRGRVREDHIIVGSISAVALAGVVTFPIDMLKHRPAASLLAAVVGVAAGTGKLAYDSLVQQNVPAARQGKTFGRLEAIFQLMWVFGALVPVLIALSLGVGGVVVTVIALAATVVYLVGNRLAVLGRLPGWWPGVERPRPARRTALGGAVGLPPVPDARVDDDPVGFDRRDPGPAPEGAG